MIRKKKRMQRRIVRTKRKKRTLRALKVSN